MRHAVLCVVAVVTCSATASAQSPRLAHKWLPTQAELDAAWAAKRTSVPTFKASPDPWEALRNVSPGTMIRVLYRDPRGIYAERDAELVEWMPGAIQVGRKDSTRIEKSFVKAVWRLDSRRNRLERVVVGAVVGFGGGFALGYAATPRDAGAQPGTGGLLIGGISGIIGGLVRTGKYESVLLYTEPTTK